MDDPDLLAKLAKFQAKAAPKEAQRKELDKKNKALLNEIKELTRFPELAHFEMLFWFSLALFCVPQLPLAAIASLFCCVAEASAALAPLFPFFVGALFVGLALAALPVVGFVGYLVYHSLTYEDSLKSLNKEQQEVSKKISELDIDLVPLREKIESMSEKQTPPENPVPFASAGLYDEKKGINSSAAVPAGSSCPDPDTSPGLNQGI